VLWKLKGRTQRCYIASKLDEQAGLKSRAIVSNCFKTPEAFSAEQANELLIDNSKKAIGYWQVQKLSDGYVLQYVAEIDPDASPDVLVTTSNVVALIADLKEKELGNGSDDY
jgi:hypothetical protein